jgi:pyruvate dehydrogenase E2 component (dihydrolipoamide acetyltransferase)
MVEVVNMPRLSDTMEQGTVAKWLKKKGDKVEEGEILAEIETDKATMEFESFHDGTLLYIGVKEGGTAPVDQLLAVIGDDDEDIDEIIKNAKSDSEADDSGDDEGKGDDHDDNSGNEASSEPSGDKSDEDSSDAEIPDGVEVVNMPRLSDTMEEGTVASWLKKEGDEVEEGETLAEIETDKATMEFESFYDGTLLHIGIKEGESAPVDSLLAVIGPEGTDVSKILDKLKDGGNKKSEDNSEEKKSSEDKQSGENDSGTESKSGTSKTENTDREAPQGRDGKRIFASPLAKKMASEKGIYLKDVNGTGENNRIVKKDIENYKPSEKPAQPETGKPAPKEGKAQQPQAMPEPYVPAGEESFEEVKASQMRKTIAKRLAESKFNAPHYYLTIEVDMETAMKSRKDINALPDTKISYNDLVLKASAMALRKHPQVNAQWTGDSIKMAKHIHLGVAVAVEEGLVVPVLRFADQMAMTTIGQNVKSLARKAQNKKLKPDEMKGSTFTVSNLGMFGIEDFTSIINQPNSAILSVGAIVEKPVVKDGEIVVGHTMKLTLANDHRVVDGATGSKFLQTLKQYLENPVTMLV